MRTKNSIFFRELMAGAGEIMRWQLSWVVALLSFVTAFVATVGYFNLAGFFKYLCIIPALIFAYIFFRTCFWPEGFFSFLVRFLPVYQKLYLTQAKVQLLSDQDKWYNALEPQLAVELENVCQAIKSSEKIEGPVFSQFQLTNRLWQKLKVISPEKPLFEHEIKDLRAEVESAALNFKIGRAQLLEARSQMVKGMEGVLKK